MNYLENVERLGVLSLLKEYSPVIAGTYPIGIEIPGSDVDIICEAHDLDKFSQILWDNFRTLKGFQIYTAKVRDEKSVICNFQYEGQPFEIFAQDMPVEKQYAVVHMNVEKRLLDMYGEPLRKAIRLMKTQGLKTEPAFTGFFKIEGDPYDELYKMASLTDEELKHKISANL